MRIEDGRRQNDELQEQMSACDRRESMLSAEINELRAAIDQAERSRKLAETELCECR